MTTGNTYSSRSNARRAGVQAGVPMDLIEITVHKVAGEKVRFGFKRKEIQVQAPAKAAGKAQRAPAATAPAKARDVRNGVSRPRAGGLCASVWAHLDKAPDSTLADVKAVAPKRGWNVNNVMCEFYRWRKFNGVTGRAA